MIPRSLRRATTLLALAAVGCGDGAPSSDAGVDAPRPLAACDSPGRSRSMVLSTYGFIRPDPMRSTVADGFDLDGRVSTAGDAQGCRQSDFTSPDGTPGIDNQVARLLPVVDMMTGGAVDGLVQAAVNNGQLLIAITLDGLDDPQNDQCVNVTVQRVQGMPFVGSDMRLDPGQTFDVAREDPPTRTTARIRNGVIEAGPFDLPLPFAALDARFILDLRGARIRAAMRPDGSLSGIIGGGVPAVPFGETLIRYGIGADLQQTLVGTLRLFSDLAPNDSGMCTQISAGLRFETRTAFVNP